MSALPIGQTRRQSGHTLEACKLPQKAAFYNRRRRTAFCCHQGAIFGGLVPLVVTYFAVDRGLGFALPMLTTASGAIIVYCLSLLAYPDTHGQEMTPDLQLVRATASGD